TVLNSHKDRALLSQRQKLFDFLQSILVDPSQKISQNNGVFNSWPALLWSVPRTGTVGPPVGAGWPTNCTPNPTSEGTVRQHCFKAVGGTVLYRVRFERATMVAINGQTNLCSVPAGVPASVPASVSQPSPSASNSDSVNGNFRVIMDTSTTAVGASSRGAGRVTDNRRSNKPIMEKRRRARINNCLNELKTLILDAMQKDPARHSKLEKADILEMTVNYLRTLQRQKQTMSTVADPASVGKFRAGFTECATEVDRFPNMDPVVKRKLLQYLASYLNQTCKSPDAPQVQVHILPNPQRSPEQQVPQPGIILSNGSGSGVQLVPTRLPNGDIALVLPASAQNQHAVPTPVPLLVPIEPERGARSVSEASSYSPSPEPMDLVYCSAQQKPLSLVVRKPDQCEENLPESVWRPW
ncbi:hypothetical protein HUJ05_008372, partial [Dendroctonus ponderosae]